MRFVLFVKNVSLSCLLLQREVVQKDVQKITVFQLMCGIRFYMWGIQVCENCLGWYFVAGDLEVWKGHLCYVVQGELRPYISNTQLPLNCWFKSNFQKSIWNASVFAGNILSAQGNFLIFFFSPQHNFWFVVAWRAMVPNRSLLLQYVPADIEQLVLQEGKCLALVY